MVQESKDVMRERSSKVQLAINMASGIAFYALNLCVTFFLTPYIVRKLGMDAYGFIGLSNNLLSYTSLVTVTINAYAGRFISVAYHSGDMEKANRYLNSVFFANLAICTILTVGLFIATLFLQDLINIPPSLVNDVKILFLTLSLSLCISVMIGVMGVGMFIKGRLDLDNIINTVLRLLQASLLLLLFGILPAKLWYFGVTALIMAVARLFRNRFYLRKLTPELHIRRAMFRLKDLLEVVSAGLWNLVTRLSNILSNGLSLLLANLFINAQSMGVLSIAQSLPSLIIGFFGMIVGNFTPELTRLYAHNDIQGMKHNLFQSMRIIGAMSAIPLSILYSYSDIFYKLWLPGQDSEWLYILSCTGAVGLITALPQQTLCQIFTITNKVKRTSLNMLYTSIATFATVIGSMFIFKEDSSRLLMLASTTSAFMALRNATFIPLYGAKCLHLPRMTFYPAIIKNTLSVIALSFISILFKYFMLTSSWSSLFLGCLFTTVVGAVISYMLIFTPSDRTFIKNRLHSAIGG